jgi:FkbM family methyltransferase
MQRRHDSRDRDLAERAALQVHEEQRLIREFFGDAPGYFIEVGAADPEQWSQTLHLERIGWTGVLIEPRPEMAEMLRQRRSAKVYAVACSSPANLGGSMTLNLAGFHSSLDAKKMAFDAKREGSIQVEVTTLDRILTEVRAPTGFDFLSIDVEGHELAVLEGFNILHWGPRLILIEDHVLSLRVHRMLQSNGYKWVRRTGSNSWYVPPGSPMRTQLSNQFRFIRKYYLGMPFRHLREAVRRIRAR